MQTLYAGSPQNWLKVQDCLYIVGQHTVDIERETQKSMAGVDVISAQEIRGRAMLFGKEVADVFTEDRSGSTKMDLIRLGKEEEVAFGQSIFTSLSKIPHYEQSVALDVEWISESIDTQYTQSLNRRVRI